VTQAKTDDTAVNPAIVVADGGFGVTLFRTLMPNAAGNIAISPLSVSLALQVLYNGAAGTTQQAMAQTLELGRLSVQDMNAANAALQASLLNADPLLDIIIANSLWTQGSAGTVAAAATTVGVTDSVASAATFTMTMNRPFLYAIVDGVTGELIFLGALMNPS